jgi:hypothetical protein
MLLAVMEAALLINKFATPARVGQAETVRWVSDAYVPPDPFESVPDAHIPPNRRTTMTLHLDSAPLTR